MTLNITNGMMTSDQTEHRAERDTMEQSWWWVTWLPEAQVCDRNQAITAMTLCEMAAEMHASGGHHLDHPQWPVFCDLAGELGMAGLDALGMVDKPPAETRTVEDPSIQLNYEIAEMIADAFGRAVEDNDIELADRIITKVAGPTMRFTLEELRSFHSGLIRLEEDYGDHDHVELREKVEAEIERLEIEEGA